MTTLVTGVAGFIGFHVAKALLDRGEQIIGIDSLNSYYDRNLKLARLRELGIGLDFRCVDFSHGYSLDETLGGAQFDRIIHLGAQVGVRHDNSSAYAQSNLVGHLNILELARSHHASMVYASSSSVYGNADLPFSEGVRTDNPVSLYAATKKSGELLSESYSSLHGIPLTGLRFFTVYGPWGRPDMAVWQFTKAIIEGQPINLFNQGNMWRDFTYIDDVVAGVIACHDAPPDKHMIYNVGAGQSESLKRMVRIIESALDRKATINLLPMQAGDVADTHADISAISQDCGYQPTTCIEEGIPLFVDWYRSYHADTRAQGHEVTQAAA